MPVDIRVDLSARFANPFDAGQVTLEADLVSPSGKRMRVPGFLYREYSRTTGKATLPVAYSSTEKLESGQTVKERSFDDAEILTPEGKPEWRVRLTFAEPGTHRMTIRLTDRNGVATKAMTLRVAASKGKGYVRIDPRDPTSFRLSTGESIFPIGCNLAWADQRGLYDFERWIPRYTKAGADWGRLWMGTGWNTFGLERGPFGTLDLANAWRLDQVLDLARKHGMRLNLAFDSYNTLRDRINWPEWERSPYNKTNGGPLTKPAEFWTSEAARRQYRNKLRYIVARWGADPSVFAWEFWNEVDGVTEYDVEKIRTWHAEMGAHLKATDPYRHLVSTSFGGHGRQAQDEKVFALKEMDFSMSHLYGEPDLALAVVEAQRRLGALGKPHLVGEIGADAGGSRSEDKEGLQIHDPLWASIAGNASGGAMLWWWDSYIDPLGLERLFTPARRFIRDVDRGRERFRSVTPTLDWVTPPPEPLRRDLLLIGGPESWTAASYNAPRRVRISSAGAQMEGGPLSSLLQGRGNHGELHNPVTFEVDLPRATTLLIEAQEISGWGGAGLNVTLDGKTVLDRAFPDPDGDKATDSLKQFAGNYPVEIPAGRHIVVVTNPGADWIRTGFRFVGLQEKREPPILAWAMIGKSTAIAWVRHEDWTWREVVENGKRPGSVAPTVLTLPRVPAGRWTAELWDTWTGEILRRETLVVNGSGARVTLPPIDRDIAVKLRRTGE